mmetsp:Transcript_25347/g.39156  ORF Transcript_25347/g.39156 Transcript_25347/m.39156 type:complete len:81 (+) Transcript_25347:2266-2508(+)
MRSRISNKSRTKSVTPSPLSPAQLRRDGDERQGRTLEQQLLQEQHQLMKEVYMKKRDSRLSRGRNYEGSHLDHEFTTKSR